MLVVVLNGFLGNRKKQLDVEDIVDASMKELGVEATVLRGRGGAGPVKFRRLLKNIEKHERKPLVFIGKSYGGHWSVKLLWKLAGRDTLDQFTSIGILTVDPAYVLHKLQRRKKEIPPVDYARNVHQFGKRSGYRLGSPATNIPVKASHTNIETKVIVTKEIEDILRWGVSQC